MEAFMRKKGYGQLADFRGLALRNVIEREEKGMRILSLTTHRLTKTNASVVDCAYGVSLERSILR